MAKKPKKVPVPQLYREAVKILMRYENKEGSLKNLVFSNRYPNCKTMYGLLCKTVENAVTIKAALTDCNLLKEQPNFNPRLALILTTELLRKGHLPGGCKPVLVLNQYADKIKQLVSSSFAERESPGKRIEKNPRYVRINTLLASVERVHAQLAKEGWNLIKYEASQATYDEFLDYVKNMDAKCYMEDYHIPDLLLFPHGTAFWDNDLYKNSLIILQDKASCLPVFLSNIKAGASVIDACAAPGNKTLYIAAAMNNLGKIKAVDKHHDRYQLLMEYTAQRGATCIKCINCNFTDISPSKHDDVEYIFVDPSCSSSGVGFHDDEVSLDRVKNLAAFQLQLLRHALSFPVVQKVIYSTCSVTMEENEKVVEQALREFGDKFCLKKLSKKLPGWKHFGKTELARRCIRTNICVDKCQGFFVAIFKRKKYRIHGKEKDS